MVLSKHTHTHIYVRVRIHFFLIEFLLIVLILKNKNKIKSFSHVLKKEYITKVVTINVQECNPVKKDKARFMLKHCLINAIDLC